ncbi:hypothetical protein [Flammeovirga sp. OC4]|nr:hypothetical protein [Flammeovirga sp. OC4]
MKRLLAILSLTLLSLLSVSCDPQTSEESIDPEGLEVESPIGSVSRDQG